MTPSRQTKPTQISRTPVLLSAFVCPGVGQFAQKRRWAGAIFVAGFLWGFCWLMVVAGQIIASFYRMAIEFDTYEAEPANAWSILPPLTIALVFYFLSLFDVVLAQRARTHPTAE